MTAIAIGLTSKAVPISACDDDDGLPAKHHSDPSARGEDVAARRDALREDARLFERYRRTGNQDAREELVERFLPLAKRVAARYRNGHDYDDLVQVASFALVKAIDRYDPDRGLAFSSFAVPTIVGELAELARAGLIESRVEFEAGPAANNLGPERFYADTRSARRGNAPLRQTGSTAGPVLYLRFVPPRTGFRRATAAADAYCAGAERASTSHHVVARQRQEGTATQRCSLRDRFPQAGPCGSCRERGIRLPAPWVAP